MTTHPSAAKSALDSPSDAALRVPCYCEENVWRLAFRKLHWEAKTLRGDDNHDDDSCCDSASSRKQQQQQQRFYVVFVSNPKGCVPMLQQLASSNRDKPIFWDYHVILLSTRSTSCNSSSGNDEGSNDRYNSEQTMTMSQIWDIDSHLPCPCPFPQYVQEVFLRHERWPSKYQPYFRVVDALVFLENFSSDRSHMMINAETGEWSAPPPEYECIRVKEDSANTLKGYMTIVEEEVRGGSGKGGNGEGNSDETTNKFGQVLSLQKLQERFGV
ncbi:MAG: hypothetical protein SGARI_007334 [Bacillariaceae sp.]